VKLLDFTPMEAIISATAGVAALFMQENELGKIKPGYYADCILVDGDPLKDITVLQDHDKLNVITINGRVHKSSFKEFLVEQPSLVAPPQASFSNFVAYADSLGRPCIGHLDLDQSTIIPLTMASGAPINNLYEVIELGNEVVPGSEPLALNSVQLLPPISGRDVLAVGKNYSEHATEFNKSGYDSSDKVDQRE
jgi:hypothetical protein